MQFLANVSVCASESLNSALFQAADRNGAFRAKCISAEHDLHDCPVRAVSHCALRITSEKNGIIPARGQWILRNCRHRNLGTGHDDNSVFESERYVGFE